MKSSSTTYGGVDSRNFGKGEFRIINGEFNFNKCILTQNLPETRSFVFIDLYTYYFSRPPVISFFSCSDTKDFETILSGFSKTQVKDSPVAEDAAGRTPIYLMITYR